VFNVSVNEITSRQETWNSLVDTLRQRKADAVPYLSQRTRSANEKDLHRLDVSPCRTVPKRGLEPPCPLRAPGPEPGLSAKSRDWPEIGVKLQIMKEQSLLDLRSLAQLCVDSLIVRTRIYPELENSSWQPRANLKQNLRRRKQGPPTLLGCHSASDVPSEASRPEPLQLVEYILALIFLKSFQTG
jgi:hypothetical protein